MWRLINQLMAFMFPSPDINTLANNDIIDQIDPNNKDPYIKFINNIVPSKNNNNYFI